MGHILLVAEAVTLAHIARPLALARVFEKLGHEVTMACSPSARRWLDGEGRPFIAIESISQRQFLNALHLGKPVFDAATLKRHVQADLALIAEVRPDVVVGDFRLSLYTSCKVAKLAYGNVTNAYWSPRFFRYAQVPDIPLTRAVGVTLADMIFRAAYRPAFAWHAHAYAQTARFFGVPPPPDGLLGAYTASDCTAYADLAELYGAPQSPSRSETFIGPLQWSPRTSLPPGHATWGRTRPLIYVTLGSSGPPEVIGKCLVALRDLDVDVVVAAAGAKVTTAPANATVLDYAPGDELCTKASVVIGNGGSPIAYQALTAGKPILGLASNLDQFLNMQRVEAAGAGLVLRAESATATDIRVAAADLAGDTRARAAAQRAQSAIAAARVACPVRAWLHCLGLTAR